MDGGEFQLGKYTPLIFMEYYTIIECRERPKEII